MKYPSPEFDAAVDAVCNGSFSEEQAVALRQVITSDEQACDAYLWRIELHQRLAGMSDRLLQLHQGQVPPAPLVLPRRVAPVQVGRAARSGVSLRWALAAAVLLCASLAWLLSGYSSRTVQFTVADINGSATWRAKGARTESPLRLHHRFAEGMISVRGTNSIVVLHMTDGTEITLVHDAVMRFSSANGVRLFLLNGEFKANVKPQPVGHPLVVQTPTAEASVLGTVLSMTARKGETLLSVDEGKVRLQRLSDGQTVLVSTREEVSTREGAVMLPKAWAPPPDTFRRSFLQAPDYSWIGEWRGGNRMGTVNHQLSGNGQQIVVPCIIARYPSNSLVTIQPQSVIEVKYRVTRTNHSITLFLVKRYRSGGFAGTVSVHFPVNQYPADADGWRIVKMPLSAFRSVKDPEQSSTGTQEVVSCLLSSYRPGSHFEISSLKILPDASGN